MINLIRFIINKTLLVIKYPIGILMLFLLPAIVMTYYQYYQSYWVWHEYTNYFMYGFVTTSLIWIVFFIGRAGFLKTLEHEIAHAFIGFLTFNPPTEINVKETGGGFVKYKGEPNWLMALAPYFIPLTAWGMIAITWIFFSTTGETPSWLLSAIGVGFGYNFFANLEQIHPKQTDFKVAGRIFTIMFLPSANLLVYGWFLSFVSGGYKGQEIFFNLIRYNIYNYDSFF